MTATITSRAEPTGAGEGAARTGWFRSWAAAWDAFWFTPSDPLPLAVIRICTGLLLAWSALVWWLDADAFFGRAHGRDVGHRRLHEPWPATPQVDEAQLLGRKQPLRFRIGLRGHHVQRQHHVRLLQTG